MSKLEFNGISRHWSPNDDGVLYVGWDGRDITFIASAEALQVAGATEGMPSGGIAEEIFDTHLSNFQNAALFAWANSDQSEDRYVVTDAILEEVIR